MSFMFGQPMLPDNILHPMIQLVAAAPTYDAANGGQWISGDETEVSFKGVVLPVSDKDLQKAPQGTYTKDSVKVYTNGHALKDGAKIKDDDGKIYLITGDLDHGLIHGLKRYVAERKGEAAPS